ncbi:MAG: KUP/HAK/KT family potassium transporter [Desulfobacterales bacterium]|nr:KUP/HAK/KT family potassium transporter [Desulfobacterales bacterium]
MQVYLLKHNNTKVLSLAIVALGVVYGDIGTSPLYAIKECFHGIHAISLNEKNVLGILSLIFWSLCIVISIKYVAFILKADNRGEGGIFALLALITANKKNISHKLHSTIVIAAVFGAALLYGDGIITPAISVLSAVEGLEVATSVAKPFIIPITCFVLFTLFIMQKRGTGKIGSVFGPIMIVWFISIGTLGLLQIIKNPNVLKAINPLYAYDFFFANKLSGFVALGSVVLCLTGGEALYADLGHFGAKAIRMSWFGIALPGLILNYFGQGALLINNPDLAFNPFYGLVPKKFLYLMVALSTIATVIASQALISGVFSLTRQAIQLGYSPRLKIIHTSSEKEGQIFMPGVNSALMIACIGLVLTFRESSRLAGAYGLAVTATMTITSLLYFFVIYKLWKWSFLKSISILLLFFIFDLSYFGANLFKFIDGGWFTFLVALIIMIAMGTWRDGRSELSKKLLSTRLPIDMLLKTVQKHNIHRVEGTAVFLTVSPIGTPPALLHHLKHNRVLHEQVALLSINSVDIPVVSTDERLNIEELGQGFFRLIANYGFMETPNVPDIIKLASKFGLYTDTAMITYYLGRETLFTTGKSKMMPWRKSLFEFMSRNARPATTYFGIPINRVVEIGTQIEL